MALNPAEAGLTGGFCSQPCVFNQSSQELLRGATEVSAQPARAVCLLCLS